jgi:hypothetical protein
MLEGRAQRKARSELMKTLRAKSKIERYLPEVKPEAKKPLELKPKKPAPKQ